MCVDFQVPVEHFIQRLLVGDFDPVLVLSQGVDNTNESGSGGQLADAVSGIVSPPGYRESILVPTRIWLGGWYVQEPSVRAHVLFGASLRAYVCFRLQKEENLADE